MSSKTMNVAKVLFSFSMIKMQGFGIKEFNLYYAIGRKRKMSSIAVKYFIIFKFNKKFPTIFNHP